MVKKIINFLIGLTIAGFIYGQFIVGDFFNSAEMLTFLVSSSIGIIVAFLIARKKHLDIRVWAGLGFLLGIFIIPFVIFWKSKNSAMNNKVQN